MKALLSPYAKKVNPLHPLCEYPRPQMRRDSFLCLNGPWQYTISQSDAAPEEYEGAILVPYPPESTLSGVERILQPEDYLWYRRSFALPPGFFKGRVLLHFGAVDQSCRVWVNGKEAGSHRGGYLSFGFDITSLLQEGDNELCVRVNDPTETKAYARGQQQLQRGPGGHPPVSGIWQTVWLESVPEIYIRKLRITPLFDDSAVELLIESRGGPLEGEVEVYANATLAARGSFVAGTPFVLPMPGALSWKPSNPFLYTLRIKGGQDAVESYFGMRKFSVEPDAAGVPRLMLNNRPLLHAGILDRGLFSDGLYTPPTEEAMVADLRYIKACGFNSVRKLGKIEPLRWYYHCDKLGLLVWQDLPGGFVPKKESFFDRFAVFDPRMKDNNYKKTGRADEASRRAYLEDMDAAVALLYNSVALETWVLFNQGEGQFDAAEAAERMRRLDPTRFIDHASGWYDQGAGDILSIHADGEPVVLPGGESRAAALTRAGGFGLVYPDHFEGTQPNTEQLLPNSQRLQGAWGSLYEKELLPLCNQGLSAFFLSQLADVGEEVCGLLTYDRAVQKLSASKLAALNHLLATQ